MSRKINFDKLLLSVSNGDSATYESVETFWETDPYIKWLKIDFAMEDAEGSLSIDIYGEKERATPIGSLFGALILGQQAYADGEDIFLACDDCDGDLLALMTELSQEGLIDESLGCCPNVLYIHSLELASEILDAQNIRQFFNRIPDFVFQYTNVKPELVTYIIAGVDGFYEKQAEKTSFDSRSVDGYSPLIFTENGYYLSDSGNLLYFEVN